MDTPDPYVEILVPAATEGKQRTATISNCKDPIWNDKLVFYIEREDYIDVTAKVSTQRNILIYVVLIPPMY